MDVLALVKNVPQNSERGLFADLKKKKGKTPPVIHPEQILHHPTLANTQIHR